jgi:hypothetical protein
MATLWTQANPHHHHITVDDWYPLHPIKGTVFTSAPTGSQEDKPHACPDIWVLENTWDIAAFVGMSRPAMIGTLTADAFPSQIPT